MNCCVPGIRAASINFTDIEHPVSTDTENNRVNSSRRSTSLCLYVKTFKVFSALTLLVSQKPCCLPAKKCKHYSCGEKSHGHFGVILRLENGGSFGVWEMCFTSCLHVLIICLFFCATIPCVQIKTVKPLTPGTNIWFLLFGFFSKVRKLEKQHESSFPLKSVRTLSNRVCLQLYWSKSGSCLIAWH